MHQWVHGVITSALQNPLVGWVERDGAVRVRVEKIQLLLLRAPRVA